MTEDFKRFNNPAGRLLFILKEGKRITDNSTCIQALCQLLEIPDCDFSVALGSYGKLIQLPKQIRMSVLDVADVNHDLYLQNLTHVEKRLSNANLQQKWSSFVSQFRDVELTTLEFCDELLSRQIGNQNQNIAGVFKLRDQVGELIAEVLGSDLEETLRQYVLEHLREIDISLADFKISGVVPARRSFEAAIGSVISSPSRSESLSKTSLGKRIINYFAWGLLIVSHANDLAQLPQTAQSFVDMIVFKETEIELVEEAKVVILDEHEEVVGEEDDEESPAL